jgi:hypothetical protein
MRRGAALCKRVDGVAALARDLAAVGMGVLGLRTAKRDKAPPSGSAGRMSAARLRTGRMFKKLVQRGRSKLDAEAYSFRYVEASSDARTKLAGFFNILPFISVGRPRS